MKQYSLGLYEKAMPDLLSWRGKLEAAQRAGFDFVEMSIDESDVRIARLDMSRRERLDLVAVMQEAGVPIRTICLSGHRKYSLGSCDAETCAKSMQIMQSAIILAEDLGVRLIQLAGYDVYYEPSTDETIRRFTENLKRASLMAAQAGIVLGFETMETQFMDTMQKVMKYVEQIHSPYLQVYPDIGNLTNAAKLYNHDVLQDFRLGNGHIAAMHLKETVPGKYREVPFGAGHVDFEKAIEAAWQAGVRQYTVEFWYLGGIEWEKDLASAKHRMGSILDNFCAEN